MKFPEQFRWENPNKLYRSRRGDPFGMFIIPPGSAKGRTLQVMCAGGQETGWDHVSVSLGAQDMRCPTWPEMCVVKDLFFDKTECVIQYHPPEEDYISVHHGCLHLWRPIDGKIPMPPKECV